MSFGIAAIVTGASVAAGAYGASQQRKAAKDASEAQVQSTEAGIAEQRRQFDALQKLLAPYVDAGTGALTKYQDLIGLNSPQQQQQAINALAQSPQFTALAQQGENALLQNASATGGLRSGNTQAALAQFRPQMLNQLIQQQLSGLGDLVQTGQASATGQATAGMNNAANIANLLGQQGAANAGYAIAKGQANASVLPNALGYIGLAKGLGAF